MRLHQSPAVKLSVAVHAHICVRLSVVHAVVGGDHQRVHHHLQLKQVASAAVAVVVGVTASLASLASLVAAIGEAGRLDQHRLSLPLRRTAAAAASR